MLNIINPVLNMMQPETPQGMPNQAHLAYLRWLREQEAGDYAAITTYRDYYDGEHMVKLTDRMRSFLEVGTGVYFNVNFMKLPIDVLKARFKIDRIESESQTDMFTQWWQAARLDGKEKAVYLSTFRDGHTFVIVSWDNENDRPRFDHNLAYDGTTGVKIAYDENDPEKPLWAIKVWLVSSEDKSNAGAIKRANVYTPDAIYKYKMNMTISDDWMPYTDDGEEWPIPWVDRRGQPLGVPVIAFKNNAGGYYDGVSELEDLLGPQNSLNKIKLDLLGAADTTGFKMFWKVGGGDPSGVRVAPGSVLWDSNPETSWGEFNAATLDGLRQLAKDEVVTIAQISQVPLKYFQSTGQVSSGDTQRADDTLLVSKAEDRAIDLGNSWEDCFYMARRLHNTFGSGGMNEDEIITAVWGSFERVDKAKADRNHAETAAIKASTFDALIMNNVPRKQAALLAGYTQEEADAMAQPQTGFVNDGITQ